MRTWSGLVLICEPKDVRRVPVSVSVSVSGGRDPYGRLWKDVPANPLLTIVMRSDVLVL